MPIHVFIDLFISLIILGLVFIVYLKQKEYKKGSDTLIKVLSENINFFTQLYKKQEVVNLKKSIDLYSQFQIILKISKCEWSIDGYNNGQ